MSLSKKSKVSRRPKKNQPWSHVHCILFLLTIAVLLSVFIGGVLYLFVLLDIPDIHSVESYRPKQATIIFDRNRKEVKRIFEENRVLIPLKKMPDLLPKAFVAAEDARFHQHKGVDFWSITRALIHNIKTGHRSQGGSTITQQVTRSLLLTRKKLYSRKIKESILAYRIDSVLNKDDILFIYLNQIYLGAGAHGVEAAANVYFGKHAKDLSLAEIALLAGLPQAPSRYSPLKNFKLARKRQAYVLNRMAEEGYITPTAARKAFNQPMSFAKKQDSNGSGHFIQHVRNYAEQKYGRDAVMANGLRIYTTLDPELQKAANKAIAQGVAKIGKTKEPEVTPQGSLISLEIHTGRVLTMVGGTNYKTSQFNRAVQAKRQPGSAFKPIIYAAALEKGFTPATKITDVPLRLPGLSSGRLWEPQNFDKKFNGPTTLREGIIHSRNIVTIKLLQEIGISAATTMAAKLGIQSLMKKNLSLALGSSDISLLELASAYAAFGNGGKRIKPIFINKIINQKGETLEENLPELSPALGKGTAYQLTLMLKGVIREGTGKRARGLRVPAAGKTGTTDHYRDAWFVGYTPELVTGVWVGHDKKRTLGTGATGGRIAAPIWLNYMKKATEKGNRISSFALP